MKNTASEIKQHDWSCVEKVVANRRKMERLEMQFLHAVDYAHSEYRLHLTLEAWASSTGLNREPAEQLRVHLQRKGIL